MRKNVRRGLDINDRVSGVITDIRRNQMLAVWIAAMVILTILFCCK